MTERELRAAWDQIKSRRGGPYATLSPNQQAGALLSQMPMGAALCRAANLADPDGHGFWAEVLGVLKSVRI